MAAAPRCACLPELLCTRGPWVLGSNRIRRGRVCGILRTLEGSLPPCAVWSDLGSSVRRVALHPTLMSAGTGAYRSERFAHLTLRCRHDPGEFLCTITCLVNTNTVQKPVLEYFRRRVVASTSYGRGAILQGNFWTSSQCNLSVHGEFQKNS